MSIAEYQLSLKKLIDATDDETLLKRWKAQVEADIAQANEKNPDSKPLNEAAQEPKAEKKDDTSDYVIIESGLGIDE